MSSIRLIKIEEDKGVTLIELMIALMMSGILIAALYRTFIGQQKTYTVQEQVVDMQQNVRGSIHRMMSEIRMAGFGSVGDVLSGGVNGPTEVITSPPSNNSITNNNSITIVGGFKQVSKLKEQAAGGQSQVTLASAADASQFDGAAHHFISIGGIESNIVSSRAGATLTLSNPLKLTHKVSVPIFKIQAITYLCGVSDGKPVLQRNENTGGGAQPLAENIENVQFEYFDSNGNPTGIASNIRMVRVTVTARTDMSDPQFAGVGGYRRRQIASNIYIRNMGSYF